MMEVVIEVVMEPGISRGLAMTMCRDVLELVVELAKCCRFGQ